MADTSGLYTVGTAVTAAIADKGTRLILESQVDVLWLVLASGLVFMMQGGFLCIEAGLTRTKNAINVAIKNLTDFGVSVMLYWAVGFGVMFGVGRSGLFGESRFLIEAGETTSLASFFIFQTMFCGAAVTILSGAVAERMRFRGYLMVAALVSALLYPLVGHWVWGGALERESLGWLGKLGFIDFAGGTVVHGVGGWAALALVGVMGARRGRFAKGERPRQIPASNLPMAVLGCLLLWIGWIGFNGGSTLAVTEKTLPVIVVTILGGAGGLVTGLLFGRALHGYHEPTSVINGSLGGLVAVTAGAHVMTTPVAVGVGAIGAIIVMVSERVMMRLRIDDAVGAVPVHLCAGIWGTLAVGLFGDLDALATGLTRWQQVGVQALGVAATGALVYPVVAGFALTAKRLGMLRVTETEEDLGLNISEHKASSEMVDLIRTIDRHTRTRDFSHKAKEEPFTFVGQIARGYNKLCGRLEEAQLDADALRVTEKKLQTQEQRLREQAYRDPLTGLYNRLGFRNELSDLMQAAQRDPNLNFALLFLDFDQFKLVNDGLGHEVGDELLAAIAGRIDGFTEELPATGSFNRRHVAARLGGDEFAVLLVLTSNVPEEARLLADRLRERLARPVQLSKHKLTTSASVGVAVYERSHFAASDLIRDADTAMYHAKRAGRNCVTVFDDTMRQQCEQRLALTQEMREAIAGGQFEPFYQPITDTVTGRVVGFEALLRWEHPARGVVSPADFIPLAEETGLIVQIGRWTLRKCLRQLAAWHEEYADQPGEPLWLAINVSRRELIEPELVEYLVDLVEEVGVPTASVHLEITESLMMFDGAESVDTIRRLHELGFHISIDDFGTGYSSLSCLHRFPFDTLKIDKSFLGEAAGDAEKAAVLEHIVAIAHTFNARVVAEGVETQQHVTLLRQLSCDLLQGYYFSRPLPLAQVGDLLRRPAEPPAVEVPAEPGDARPSSLKPLDCTPAA